MDSQDLSPTMETRRKLRTAKRDNTGFSVDAQPHLTHQQVKWIATRAGVGSNAEACEATGVELLRALEWMEQPDFLAIYLETMENKREGFKALVGQSLPLVLTTLLSVMQHGEKDADRVKAATLLMRNQALLVDKVTTADPDAIRALVEEIRKPRPVPTYKVLPNPKDRDAAS